MKNQKILIPLAVICLSVFATGCQHESRLPSLWPESKSNPNGPSAMTLKIPEFKAPTFKKSEGPGFWERFMAPKTQAVGERLSNMMPSNWVTK